MFRSGTYKFLFAVLFLIAIDVTGAKAQSLGNPRPEIVFLGTTREEFRGKTYRNFFFEVVNRFAFPDEFFEPAPDLAPCGRNANASQMWLEFFDAESGKPIMGHCALLSRDYLARVGFARLLTDDPPESIYIELIDRRTRTIYRSKKLKIRP